MTNTLKAKIMALIEDLINEVANKERTSRYDAAFAVACGMTELAATHPNRDIKALRALLGIDKASMLRKQKEVGTND